MLGEMQVLGECMCMHVKVGIRDQVRRGKGVCAPGWKRAKAVGRGIYANQAWCLHLIFTQRLSSEALSASH